MTSAPPPHPVVVLISGRGSNLRALIERSLGGDRPYRVAGVLSDQPRAAGLAVAASFGIPAEALPPGPTEERTQYDLRLAAAIEAWQPRLVVLAGFMRVLGADFVNRHAGRMVNVHPSLLPAHPGLHTHRRALAAGDRDHGATVHFVTAELDGGPRIIQARLPVLPEDTEATLATRVQALEHVILPQVVDWFCAGRLRCREGSAWLDGTRLVEPVLYDAGSLTRGD